MTKKFNPLKKQGFLDGFLFDLTLVLTNKKHLLLLEIFEIATRLTNY